MVHQIGGQSLMPIVKLMQKITPFERAELFFRCKRKKQEDVFLLFTYGGLRLS